jgi:hypothetical protein
LFGRYEIGRAQHLTGQGQVGISAQAFCEAEVSNPRLVEGINQDIRGLKIAMENALLVSIMHRLRDRLEVSRRAPGWQRLIPHQFCQRTSLDEVHREIGLPVLFAHVMNCHDVRMLQRRSRTGLSPKPLHQIGTAERAKRKKLQRDDSVQVKLPSFIDRAHPSLANLFRYLVITKPTVLGLRPGIIGPHFLFPDRYAQFNAAQLEQALGTEPFRGVPGQFLVTLIAQTHRLHIRYRSNPTQT